MVEENSSKAKITKREEGEVGPPLPPFQNIYVVLNPIAGHSSAGDLRQAIEQACSDHGIHYEIYETSGEENLADVARQAVSNGAEMVVAAGGDGTVAGVVNGLAKSQVPVGIIPVGTGNGLARALGIPLNPPDAIQLIIGDHERMHLDAMQVHDRYFVLNVSAGISPRAMRSTDPETKRRFGILAYAWTILKQLAGYQPRSYNLTLDGHQIQVRAAEILVSNGAMLKEPPFPLGPRELFNDGRFDVYILTARTLADYLRLAWGLLTDPNKRKAELRTLSIRDAILIEAVRQPQPVQADGEVIGKTPIEVKIVADAIQVIIPGKSNGK